MDAVVTTSRRPRPEEVERARIHRRTARDSLRAEGRRDWRISGAEAVLVVTKERLVVETAAGKMFFHPGMARPRIRSLGAGGR